MKTTKAKTTKKQPSAGRPPQVETLAGSIKLAQLREFIDKNEGVISSMVRDRQALRAIGLEAPGGRALSRMTLIPRLQAVKLRIDGQEMKAHDYATIVRVKAGKSGPRSSRAAQQAASATAEERAQVLDALARTTSVSEAARALNVPRHKLAKRISALGIEEEHIAARRTQIATCPACAAKTLGTDGPKQQHTCK